MEKQDSRPDTFAHINRVSSLLADGSVRLCRRGAVHDQSKLEEPEKSAFDRLKALQLSGMDYGSEEYRACLRKEKPAIEHHYQVNSHHPEHFPKRDSEEIQILQSALQDSEEYGPLRDAAQEKVEQLQAPINGMSLFDVMEMVMDWKAATERMKDGGNIRESLKINADRFHLSPQLVSIINNTIVEMGW